MARDNNFRDGDYSFNDGGFNFSTGDFNFQDVDVTFTDGERNRGNHDIDCILSTSHGSLSLCESLHSKDYNQIRNGNSKFLNDKHTF